MGFFDFLRKANDKPKSQDSLNKDSEVSLKDKHFTSDIEKKMYINNTSGYRDLKDQLDYQDDLLKALGKADEKYEKDGDIDSYITAYEKVLLESNPPLASTSNTLYLAELYIKTEQFNKAWGYLNSLIGTDRAPLNKIRHEQSRILKKEKKHIEAIEMILLEFLAKSEWNNKFNREQCIKSIGPSIRALGWSSEDQTMCADFVDYQVSMRRYGEKELIDRYRKFVRSKSES